MSRVPTLTQFDPNNVKWQIEVLREIDNFDYSLGVHEVLLSGSVGSAKTLLMAHIGILHCINNTNARVCIGRRTMPELKDTLLQTILDHMEDDFVEGKDYYYNKVSSEIRFSNGSEIVSKSWADKKYKKFRSHAYSLVLIEELTENDSEECDGMHTEMIGRVGRITGIDKCLVVYASNPDSPSHWAYDYFINGSLTNATRHVYYSLTSDNPFLPPWYIEKLKTTYDDKICQRMIYGKWIHIESDVIYYGYNVLLHWVLQDTKPNPIFPLRLTFDFNIGEGKPMSCAICQYIESNNPQFIFIDEVVVFGSKTSNVMEEIAARGYFNIQGLTTIIIHGDATGRHRDTRSIRTDYEIIIEFINKYQRKDGQPIKVLHHVPLANPPVRDRHNILNGQLCNAKQEINIKIDTRCKVINEGFQKTKLVSGGKYIEDDSKHYQHIITAIGYMVHWIKANPQRPMRIENLR